MAQKKERATCLGALLPDTIRVNNHMIISRMSSEEYNSKCQILSTRCTNVNKLGNDCNAHTSKQNLEKISNTLKVILRQSENVTKDWGGKEITSRESWLPKFSSELS